MDMNDLLQQAMAMQQNLAAAQQEAASIVHTGQAGGGMVKIEVSGAMEFLAVHIDPKVIDPNEVDMLCDLILAALRDAGARIAQAQEQVTSQAMSGIDLGALGLSGLPGTELPGTGGGA